MLLETKIWQEGGLVACVAFGVGIIAHKNSLDGTRNKLGFDYFCEFHINCVANNV